MTVDGNFPFGQKIKPVVQKDKSPKKVFVLGVYASAVHARWVGSDGKTLIRALAVASEPEIFWRGEGVEALLSKIKVPAKAGRLLPASDNLNGPSGHALDDFFLSPLRLSRDDAWLSDLVPYSCKNPRQAEAVKNKYMPLVRQGLLPKPKWMPVPKVLASPARRVEIESEFNRSKAPVVITLGDQPLRWFFKHYGSRARLATYGKDKASYGQLHPINVNGREVLLLPLVHPRQAAGLGAHSKKWRDLHTDWVKTIAPRIAKQLQRL